MEQVKEQMLYDLYGRERLKSRPAWASDQKLWEKEIWEYRRMHRIPRTAHVEVFSSGQAVLFDYERRDPLTNNAYMEVIDWENL